jgi:sigma-B regulation protein RsbU (phosphoserine phosphatase)
MTVSSRPSLIVPRLFGSLGRIAPILGIVLLVVAAVFLLVEVVSLILSLRLTRTITRTVHDLYIGTEHIASGEFSHKIPVRSKDQLSDLASSFNGMTERIQQLIEEVKEKEKLEAELEIAREVQAQLFPKDIPHLKTLELAGVCKPARVVSGDYYDFIPVDARRTAIVIGDISGKGISAALLMASVQAALHAQLSTMNGSKPDTDSAAPSTSILVTRLNRQLFENTSPEKYATFYCALYDDSNSRLVYTNAGHLRPILVREGKASRLEISGMVVGMFLDAPYDQTVIELQQGDLLAAFTDGITESENEAGEQFGEDHLAQLLVENAAKPLNEIVELVTREVRTWAYDLDNQDDTTMLLARRV